MRKIYAITLVMLLTSTAAFANNSYANATPSPEKISSKEAEKIFTRSYKELIKWLEMNSFSLTQEIKFGANESSIKVIVDKERDAAVYNQGVLVASTVNNQSYLNPELTSEEYGEELGLDLLIADELGFNKGVTWYKIGEEDVGEFILNESSAIDSARDLLQVFEELNPNYDELLYAKKVVREANALAAFTLKNDIEEQLRFVAKDANNGDSYSKGLYKRKSGTVIKLKIKDDFAEIVSVSNSKNEKKFNITWHPKGDKGDGDIKIINKNSVSSFRIKDKMLISYNEKETGAKAKSIYSLTVGKNTFDVLAPTEGVLGIKEIRQLPLYKERFDKLVVTYLLWDTHEYIVEEALVDMAWSGGGDDLTLEALKNAMNKLEKYTLGTLGTAKVVLYDKAVEISTEYGAEKAIACVPIKTEKITWGTLEVDSLIQKYRESSVPRSCSEDGLVAVKTITVSNTKAETTS